VAVQSAEIARSMLIFTAVAKNHDKLMAENDGIQPKSW